MSFMKKYNIYHGNSRKIRYIINSLKMKSSARL